jgi:zinc ribbon protein
MKCTACGNENQPGAKFCVHCGIVLVAASAPAWTAAPASAAPTAASAPPLYPAAPAQPTPAPSVARPAAASGPAPAVPTAAPESPRKTGLIIGVVALLVVLGAGGYFGYRMLSGEAKETVAIVEPPKPAETPPSPASAPSVVPAAPATDTSATRDAAPTAAPAASPPTVAPTGTGAAPPKRAAPAATEAPLPGRSPTAVEGKTESGQTKAAPAKAPSKAVPPGSEAPSKAAPASAAAPTPPGKAAAKAPAVAPVPDRWQMMAEAMAQCSPAQFFSRLACEQRTRARYCEGFWGQVPQCPNAPTKDHGQ